MSLYFVQGWIFKCADFSISQSTSFETAVRALNWKLGFLTAQRRFPFLLTREMPEGFVKPKKISITRRRGDFECVGMY